MSNTVTSKLFNVVETTKDYLANLAATGFEVIGIIGSVHDDTDEHIIIECSETKKAYVDATLYMPIVENGCRVYTLPLMSDIVKYNLIENALNGNTEAMKAFESLAIQYIHTVSLANSVSIVSCSGYSVNELAAELLQRGYVINNQFESSDDLRDSIEVVLDTINGTALIAA